MALRSITSRKRTRYGPQGSSDRDFRCAPAVGDRTLPPPSWFAISVSIRFVTSGRAGAPSGVENLIPLYSGGLWEAVKFSAPSAADLITAYEIAGVGAGSAITIGLMPCAPRISAAI